MECLRLSSTSMRLRDIQTCMGNMGFRDCHTGPGLKWGAPEGMGVQGMTLWQLNTMGCLIIMGQYSVKCFLLLHAEGVSILAQES